MANDGYDTISDSENNTDAYVNGQKSTTQLRGAFRFNGEYVLLCDMDVLKGILLMNRNLSAL